MKKYIKYILYLGLVLFLAMVFIFFKHAQEDYLSITTFEDCVRAGYEVLTTYPEQCKMPGRTFTNTQQIEETLETVATSTETVRKNSSPKNSSYTLDGNVVSLVDGESISTTTPSSSSLETAKYYGNELRIDLNEDGTSDSAFLLTYTTSGTGFFYYLVVALNKKDTYTGINGILLGDRIEPLSTEFKNGEIVVTYFDRLPTEPMVKKPSHKVSRHFKVMNDTLVEILE